MKILVFSHIPLKFTNENILYPGGGWIYAYIDLFRDSSQHELGIINLGSETTEIKISEKITVFTVKKTNSSNFKKLLYNLSHSISAVDSIDDVDLFVKSFRPDIIQVFGTESEFGLIVLKYQIPAVIHVQGILVDYLNFWFPRGVSKFKVFINSNILNLIKGSGLFHDYFRTKKMVYREQIILKSHKYFFGRTKWDEAITQLYNPDRKYFHIDELIRKEFYIRKWRYEKSESIEIISTMNENLYKGLDFVLKTARILKELGVNFEWNIIGLKENNQIKPVIESLIKDHFDLNNVNFKGILSAKKVAELLQRSTLYVHPASIDNSPNSVCEAMILGTPVIATYVGGIPSLISNGIDGILVPFNDPQMLAFTILEVAENEEFLKLLSRNALDTSHKRHNPLKIKNDLICAYEEIINYKNISSER